jgi:GxxExxY protein
MELNRISEIIIGKAIEVHKVLGPGLLESTYEACLKYELSQAGLKVERQKFMPIIYKGITIENGYRLDMIIEDIVIIELKSIELVLPIHKAQLLSYLRLAGISLGLLINFNVDILKNGIVRVVNNYKSHK